MKAAAEKFREVEEIMKRDYPESVAQACALARNVCDPKRAPVDKVWSVLWDKPLYAYTKVKIGDGYVAQLRPFVNGQAWKTWGDPERPIVACTGKGSLETSFHITKHAPPSLAGLTISRARLYAVGGAARALNKWSSNREKPAAGFLGTDSKVLLKQMRNDLGLRWGHITIMHFLTDMGLFCKPDRWLVRSAHALGIANGCNPQRDVPTRREAILIDSAVKRLVIELYGKLTGPRLRYVDKMLMEASRRGVLKTDPA